MELHIFLLRGPDEPNFYLLPSKPPPDPLLPGPYDPPPVSRYELEDFYRDLVAQVGGRSIFRNDGSPPIGASLGSVIEHTGEFVVALTAFAAPLAALLCAWIKAHYGRKVRLEVGDVKAEARTVEDIERLLKMVQKSRKKIR
jgi:hypothetical protein